MVIQFCVPSYFYMHLSNFANCWRTLLMGILIAPFSFSLVCTIASHMVTSMQKNANYSGNVNSGSLI